MGLRDLFAAHGSDTNAAKHTIKVEGMHCHSCEKLVSTALADRGAKNVSANHKTGVVEYEGELEQNLISEAITEAGFTLL